jgi:DNA helicase-2/ATP-dependent DNA helicase PcrA
MTRGPAWQRAAAQSSTITRAPAPSERGPAASVGAKPRSDLAIGMRVFHEKFGYGAIVDIDGNKLDVEFDQAGSKKVLDGFVRAA